MTLKEQLDEANSKLATAESERDDFKSKHEAEVKAHGQTKTKLATAETERDEHKAKHEGEVKAHNETKTKLSESEAKDKTAGAKAAEQLAAKGIPPVAKDEPGKLDASAGDPVALWEQYANANATTQAEMRAKHGDKLDAAAAAFDAANPPKTGRK